ncbi:hypothetical protein ACFX1R_039500 [Malus domestica]
MTRHVGQFIRNQIGKHILTDQSRKREFEGMLLRIRVELDITQPFRMSLLLSSEGSLVSLDLRYEKLPITCFLCGIVGHIEDQCEKFIVKNDDDFTKPYGRWFQNNVLDTNYHRPQGTHFGLEFSQGWSMKVPLDLDEEECNISSVEPPVDLTLTVVNQKDKSDASYDLRLFGFDLNVPHADDYEVLNTTGLKFTGGTSETSIGDKALAPHGSQIVEDSCAPRFGKFDMGSDPFNLIPIIE